MRRRDVLRLGMAAVSAIAAPFGPRGVLAQGSDPSRPIHVIVPSSAGGVHDIIARIWADRVKSSLGSVIVEDRGGGGSSIALNLVAQSPADGYMQFQKKLMDSGFEPMLGLGPEQADLYLKQEFARWSPVVQALGTQNQ